MKINIYVVNMLIILPQLFSCVTTQVEKPARPAWIDDTYSVYPRDTWLAFIGHGSDRQSALNESLGFLATAFNIDITSSSQSGQFHSQYLYEDSYGETVEKIHQQESGQKTDTASDVSNLMGVQTEFWIENENSVYALSLINRKEGAANYQNKVIEYSALINDLLAKAESSADTLTKYECYTYAYSLALDAENYQKILETLEPQAIMQKPDYGSSASIDIKANKAAKNVTIHIGIPGDENNILTSALSDFFSSKGFQLADKEAAEYSVHGKLLMTERPFTARQKYKPVDYSFSLSFTNKNKATLFSWSVNDEESNFTIEQAKQKIFYRLEESLKSGEFAKAFDQFLGDLHRR